MQKVGNSMKYICVCNRDEANEENAEMAWEIVKRLENAGYLFIKEYITRVISDEKKRQRYLCTTEDNFESLMANNAIICAYKKDEIMHGIMRPYGSPKMVCMVDIPEGICKLMREYGDEQIGTVVIMEDGEIKYSGLDDEEVEVILGIEDIENMED